jgi:hypothetical protein
MSKCQTFSEMFELYLLNRKLLKDWTFIVSTNELGNIDLYAGMEDLDGIKVRLFTPFANGRISVINNRIVRRCLHNNDSITGIHRWVSFDTQTVSYIEKFYRKGEVPYNGFETVLKLLKGAGFGIDHIPYTLENMMFDTSRKECVEQTLYAYEMLCSENAGNENVCRKRAQEIVAMYENDNFVVPFCAKELYKMVYLVLIKMSQIQFKHHSLSVNDKLNIFVEYMAINLCKIMQPEINLAKLFFTKGNGCGFFGKIQTGNKKVLDQLKNMTWDLLHLRFMDFSSTIYYTKKADAHIPYFFTYDKRLQDVRECYSLQTLAVNPKEHSIIPIYVFQDGVFDIVKNYFCYENQIERLEYTPDLDVLIKTCEQELIELV